MLGVVLAIAAAGLWAGILLAGVPASGLAEAPAVGLLSAGFAALVAAVVWRRRGSRLGRVRTAVAVGLAFVLLGVGWGGLHDARVRHSRLAATLGRTVEARGTLASQPEAGALGWTATLRIASLIERTDAGEREVSATGAIWAEGRGPPPDIAVGSQVVVEGLLESVPGSFGTYLRHRGYAGALSVASLHAGGPPANPFLRAADAMRASLARSLARVFPAREAGLLLGLTLGDTSRLDPIVAEQFRATGLTHLLAVSGENVAMFLAPILALAQLCRLGRAGRFVVGLGAIAFFALLTRAEPSVLRASAMAGLVLVGVFLGRPRSPPAIMGAAILILLAMDPTLVYAVGFQLSVAATAGIALLGAPLAERLRWMPRPIALAAATTLAAQAGVTPLLLHYFGAVPTITIVANVLAFPAVGPGMLLGLLAAAAGIASPAIGMLAARVASVPLSYLEALAARLAHAPVATITGGGGAVALAIGVALVGAIAWWLRSGRRLSRRATVAIGTALALVAASGAASAGPPRSFTVVFFDVGQGDAALIRSPAGATILIDGGPDPEQVATKLAALGIHRLDLMVATHPHADHVAGLAAVLARVWVGMVVDPGCAGSSPFYAQFLRAVAATRVPMRHPRPGEVLMVGDVRVEVLGPEHCFSGTDSDPNNDSLVLRVSDGSASVLFPGDAEQPAQTDVLRDEPGFMRAEVLKVPHHGGDTSLDAFVGAVGARVAVVSVGPNRYGHPVPAVLATLARDGMRVFRTDRAGDVTVTFDAHGIEVAGSGP
ncbi:MAG TPA: DNA internalization-related competence protein ComEC/Rec2 [Actinomycetota bacterium]